ncbi:FeoC-like transcriptional regulator [Vibrio sp. JC009]|uniref:FeoC-like transcriptional regulator n=1 Tax=Vibrio sp. JC009 TaxID=2912314 RepID=UPI0023B173E9|nr:FeoC-like transcriptional regulator [Vibrio sp. JC009]WED24015.1 FeoC-like transcriptional regulator [Vibrio sp. JC009]
MIVSQLKAYIEQHSGASRTDLAKRFALSEDGVDAMLEIWIKKGEISRITDTSRKRVLPQVRYRSIGKNNIAVNIIL